MKNKLYIILLLSAFVFSACGEDFLNTKSTSQVDQGQIFETTETAQMAVEGLHRAMYYRGSSAPQMGYGVFVMWNEMLGEDLVHTKQNAQWSTQAKWSLHRNTTSSHLRYLYKFFYELIANANMVIESIDAAEGPENHKDNLKGQALAYRAFAHYCLVQLWAKRYDWAGNNTQDGVILRLTNSTDPAPRATVEEVYAAINEDLDESIRLLAGCGITRSNKSQIDVNVVRGIKARVLLTTGRFADAAAMAEQVINQSGAALSTTIYEKKQGRMCDASNSEWIWGKVDEPTLYYHYYYEFFSYISNTNVSYNKNTPRAIYNLLYARIPETDIRKTLWLENAPGMDKKEIVYPPAGNIFKWMSQKYIVDYPDNTSSNYNGSKFTADIPYMRIAEMYLIAAEAYARTNNESKAKDLLTKLVVTRDPAYAGSSNSGEALIEEILFQRRIELWGEGFRFCDLKRLHMALDRGPKPREGYNQGGWKSNAVQTNLDPLASNYNMYDAQETGEENRYRDADSIEWQFVIPQLEIDYNPLCKQNPI